MSDARDQLETLARLYSIETSYHDISGQRNVASDSSIHRMLRLMEVNVENDADVRRAVANRRQELANRVMEPVAVVWYGSAPVIPIRLPENARGGRYRIEISLEDGSTSMQEGDIAALRLLEAFELAGRRYADIELRLADMLPCGYHHLRLELSSGRHDSLLICAPEKGYIPSIQKLWGVFAPTYSLRSQKALGAGGFSELSRLVDLVQKAGGHVVGTLPLMAAFLDELYQPSPYVPVSKLFWNEMFLDLEQIAYIQNSAAAKAKLQSTQLKEKAAELKSQSLVDYKAYAKLHRSVLEILAQEVFETNNPLRTEIETRVTTHPRLADYARF